MTKLYKCEIDGCETMQSIRTTIKDRESEYYGKRVCNSHANQLKPKKVSEQTKRTQEKRKEQRKDYPEFYQMWVERVKGWRCHECGKILQGNSTEVAHILSKSTSPEVATNDLNIIPLCTNHHTQFDRSLEKRSQMECFAKSSVQYELLKPLLKNNTAETNFYENYLQESE